MDTDDTVESVMTDLTEGATCRSLDRDEPEYDIHNPIVYTTKLDEMKIFMDNTTELSVETFVNSIIEESKPKFNLKRKCSQPIHYHNNSYEDLSRHINSFNRKVARIARNNYLLSVCKPVNIVLEDIKYTLQRRHRTGNPKVYGNKKHKSTLIYDKQREEADMYTLDKNFVIKEYHKFRIDKNYDNILCSLKNNIKVSEVTCCCWYDRENFLKTLTLHPLEILRFMRKPHNCVFNRCRCCCRKIPASASKTASSISPQILSESPSIWLKKMTESSKPPSDTSKTLLLKSLRVELPKKEHSVKEENCPFLHSTNIDFGGEYYIIGEDGQIKFYLKKSGNVQRNVKYLPKSANNIVGSICCWYKREEFACRLLSLNALPSVVNYIRSAHQCSSTKCNCCCKPLNTNKIKLTPLLKTARHTNDMVNKKINIKVKFPGAVTKPNYLANAKQVSSGQTKVNAGNKSQIASFNVSLSALEKISQGKSGSYIRDVFDLVTPESATFDPKTSIRVLIDTTPRYKTPKYRSVIECADLESFSVKELRMIDIIFRAINNTTKQPEDEPIKISINPSASRRRYKKTTVCYYNTSVIYPLLLNTQLSITTDLRSKRFLPSLRAHIEKYKLPGIKHIGEWLKDEVSPGLKRTNSAQQVKKGVNRRLSKKMNK